MGALKNDSKPMKMVVAYIWWKRLHDVLHGECNQQRVELCKKDIWQDVKCSFNHIDVVGQQTWDVEDALVGQLLWKL
jgi:hypothetical protein